MELGDKPVAQIILDPSCSQDDYWLAVRNLKLWAENKYLKILPSCCGIYEGWPVEQTEDKKHLRKFYIGCDR